MGISRGALLRACLLASVPIAAFSQAPVVVEAESGTLGGSLTTGSDAAAGVDYITVMPAANSPATPTPDRVATYNVTFPAAGSYALYVRILTGPNGGNDDSFYIGNGFNNSTNWAGPYNTSTGGATAPGAGVPSAGTAGQNVWKWVRITSIPGIGGGIGPSAWDVPAGALTQTFYWGSREDGLLFDKFAFAPVSQCHTVADLDAPRPSTVACPVAPPAPPAYNRPPGSPLAAGQPKFLGSAHSPGTASLNFGAYWNQVTPENGGKWGAAQPRSPFGPADQGYPLIADVSTSFSWDAATAAYNQAKDSGSVFKWHTLFWGNQQPAWIESLPQEKQLEAIHIWLSSIAQKFPNIDEIDVVNEPLHDPPRGATNGNYIEALGGDGATGWDWIINAFTLARQYFPNSKLILNDYSITNASGPIDDPANATTRYLAIIKLLQDRGLIDGIGIQAHAFEYNYNNLRGTAAQHSANLGRLGATGLPIYVTEFDIDAFEPVWGLPDDATQVERWKVLFPVFWEHPSVKGVTLWGYMQNSHWRSGQGDWLMYTNGAERPALTWLVQYMEDHAPTVNPGQVFSVAENATETPETQQAIQALQERGFSSYNSDHVITMMLLIKNPQGITALNPNTNQMEFWPGGADNYDGTNIQFMVWSNWGAATVGPQLGVLTATDVDPGQTLSDWRIEEGGGWFSLDARTGQLAQKPFPPLDFDWYPGPFILKVTVSDGFKRSAPQTVVVNLTNVNDNAPVIKAGQSYRIDGGRNNTVAQVLASDADDTHQPGFTRFSGWAITSGNTNTVFRFNGTGELQVARPLLIDWRRSSYTLGTRVSDGVNPSEVEPVQVTIPSRVNLCLLNAIRLEAPKVAAPALILLGSELGSCSR